MDPHHSHRGLRARVAHALKPHAHDAHDAIQSMTAEQSSRYGIRAAWIGLAAMMATALLQVVIVTVSGSIALLADTVHNIGHAATTIPLIIAFRLGQRTATKRYPYGYRRAEDLVGLLISFVIALSAVAIIVESVRSFVNPPQLTSLGWVFAAGIIGALGNELVAIYRIRAGRRIGSAALIAEGQHARIDGFTSIAVVLGVIGVWLGMPVADAIVGLIIAIVIMGIGVNSLKVTVRRLLDGVEDGLVDQIAARAAEVDEVVAADRPRARWSGHRLLAEIDIAVLSGTDFGRAQQIAERVERHLRTTVAHLDSVTVRLSGAAAEPTAAS